MRNSYLLPALAVFAVAAALAYGAAMFAVARIETNSLRQISGELNIAGLDWAGVTVDGLQVSLTGTAPDEATRFRAVTLAGKLVDPTRVIDRMQVNPGKVLEAPRFSIEILRNMDGISLIGLVPEAMDRAAVVGTVSRIAEGAEVTDLLESADWPVPGGWVPALAFGLDALAELPRSKISVAADRVAITAITKSVAHKQELEAALRAALPDGIELALDLSAPRPVITPYTLRYLIDENGGRFDACTAHTEAGRARIITAARTARLVGEADCTLGLGVPSPKWPDAVVMAITALDRLGGGSVTFSNADITLVARDNTDPATFDDVVGELDTALPQAFSLHAVLPEPVTIDGTGEGDGPPEFVATLSPEGLLQIRGRISDARLREAVTGFARARFGGAEVHGAMRIDEDLPEGWPKRVLAALDALSYLANGSAVVQPAFVALRGTSTDADAKAEISRILSDQLGEAENFSIDVTYEERLDPETHEATPEECVTEINRILAARQVTFSPGSTEIDAAANETIQRIAEVMAHCSAVPMEIGGHTDSQGRESMNERLSQSRAEAVLSALLARRVLTGNLTARGYGEAVPVADNGTEEGREANRRIEFRLIEDSDTAADAEPGAEDVAAGSGTADAAPATETIAPEDGGATEDDAAPAQDGGTEEDGAASGQPVPVRAPEPRPERPATGETDDPTPPEQDASPQ